MKKAIALIMGAVIGSQMFGAAATAAPTEKKMHDFETYDSIYNPPGFSINDGGTKPEGVVLSKGAQKGIYGNLSTSVMINVDASQCDQVPFEANYSPYIHGTDEAVTDIKQGEKVYYTYKLAADDMNFEEITFYSKIDGNNVGNFIKIDKNGSFYHTNGGSTANTPIQGVTFRAKKWYTIELVTHIENEYNKNCKLDVYVNGNQVAKDKTIFGSIAFDQINSMRVAITTKNGTKIYVDDIGYQVLAEDTDDPLMAKPELSTTNELVTVDNDNMTINCERGVKYSELDLAAAGATVTYFADEGCTTAANDSDAVDIANAAAVVTTEQGGLFYYSFNETTAPVPEPTWTRYDFETYNGQWNPENFNMAGTMPTGAEIKKIKGDSKFGSTGVSAGIGFAAKEGESPFPLEKEYNPYMDCNDKIAIEYLVNNGFYYAVKLAIDRPFTTENPGENVSVQFRTNTEGSGGNIISIASFSAAGLKVLNNRTTASDPADTNVFMRPNRWYNVEAAFDFVDEQTAIMNVYVDGVNVAKNRTVNAAHFLENGGISSLRTSILAKNAITVYVDNVTYEAKTENSNTSVSEMPEVTVENGYVNNAKKTISCADDTTYGQLSISGGDIKIYTDDTYTQTADMSSEVDKSKAVAILNTANGNTYAYDFVSSDLSPVKFYKNSVEDANVIEGGILDNSEAIKLIANMNVVNYSNESIKIRPIIALYKNSRFVRAVAGEQMSIENNGEIVPVQCSVDVPEKVEGETYTVKCFVWDGLSALKPYTIPVTLRNSFE